MNRPLLGLLLGGVLGGTPDRAGQWLLTLQVMDAEGVMVAGQVQLRATELVPLVVVDEEVRVPIRTEVDVPLTARGGVPPYTWGISQGALQAGLTLDPAGRLLGRVEEASTATVTCTVSDAEGGRAEREVFVLARSFRSGTAPTSRDRGGCVCVTPARSANSVTEQAAT